ncbi:MAG: AAA family ATPase [Planctomycetota bacterium]|nr:AAA family ATPase [Planctomycetota bacterium]
MSSPLPAWAREMQDLFKSGSVAQFLLHGNLFDVVPVDEGSAAKTPPRMLSLGVFLDEVMFSGYDGVLHYDRGRGIRATRGGDDWGDWLKQLGGAEALALAQTRESGAALELIDRYLLRSLNLQAIKGKPAASPMKIAVVIEFAEFVVPRGDALQLGGPFSANVVKILGWANDPAILQANVATVLMTEGLHDLNELVVENPHAAKLRVPLPDEAQMTQYVGLLAQDRFPDLAAQCDVPLETLSRRLTGLSRVGAMTVISTALTAEGRISAAYLAKMKKDLIERECQGLLEFMESPYTLDNVSGHEAVKTWLREDAQLLRRGACHALPMGYLITGRIGTGKTFLVQCWAGELGIPCVAFKNFRDRWVGASEGNLEKIFAILRALGQAMVFVDEADQVAGKRDSDGGDSGLSGRIYAMLAREMSETRNRGKVIWVFATSRPDLLEVDLKRQGRLDVHIPLFPPQTQAETNSLLLAVAKKLKFPLSEKDLPDLPDNLLLGGHEVEGVLVRALRRYELCPEPRPALKDLLLEVMREARPNAQTKKLEYMDLVAVRECTDERFLTPAMAKLSPEDVESRIAELRRFM